MLSRDLDRYRQTSCRTIEHFKLRGCSVKPHQPRLCVGETQTFAAARFERAIYLKPRSIVFHFNAQRAVSGRGGDLDVTRATVADCMAHRILDYRLQDEVGNANVE